MGINVDQLSAPAEAKPSKIGYVREFKEELRKVTWTTKEELALFTKIVVGSTFLLGIGIYGVDLVIKTVLNGFGGLIHLMIGR